MKIEKVIIEDQIKEKVFSKHHVEALEIKGVLMSNPLVFKSKLGRYLAIGNCYRFVTIIFECKGKTANIITAYPSSQSQIKLYKKKRQ